MTMQVDQNKVISELLQQNVNLSLENAQLKALLTQNKEENESKGK